MSGANPQPLELLTLVKVKEILSPASQPFRGLYKVAAAMSLGQPSLFDTSNVRIYFFIKLIIF